MTAGVRVLTCVHVCVCARARACVQTLLNGLLSMTTVLGDAAKGPLKTVAGVAQKVLEIALTATNTLTAVSNALRQVLSVGDALHRVTLQLQDVQAKVERVADIVRFVDSSRAAFVKSKPVATAAAKAITEFAGLLPDMRPRLLALARAHQPNVTSAALVGFKYIVLNATAVVNALVTHHTALAASVAALHASVRGAGSVCDRAGGLAWLTVLGPPPGAGDVGALLAGARLEYAATAALPAAYRALHLEVDPSGPPTLPAALPPVCLDCAVVVLTSLQREHAGLLRAVRAAVGVADGLPPLHAALTAFAANVTTLATGVTAVQLAAPAVLASPPAVTLQALVDPGFPLLPVTGLDPHVDALRTVVVANAPQLTVDLLGDVNKIIRDVLEGQAAILLPVSAFAGAFPRVRVRARMCVAWWWWWWWW
jgi:hypothetical protein